MTDPNSPDGLIGQIIADRYRMDKKLGGGGMGEVYLAEHVRLKRKCAIKVLRSALSEDNDALQRFKHEAENASMISHPNVAQVYDFGEHGTLLYLAMEFIEGRSMQEVLEEDGVMHPDMVADVIMQSASALAAAHAQQVLHRDVKPDNIMLARNSDGTYLVKLVDFGIARAMASTDRRVTQTGMVVGTPDFMSPEQIAGEPLDARSDLYSLALVAFVGLTGASAFPDSGSMEGLILRLTSRPRTLIEARQGVDWPPRLQTVFDRALAPQRDARHADVVAFASDLSDAIEQMSPSETTAFYRRALEARALHPVALTAGATPAKPVKGKSRDKKATAKSSAAPPPPDNYRPMGMPPRATQVAYAGPGMKKSTTGRNMVLAILVAAGGVLYFDKDQLVLTKLKELGVPVGGVITRLRAFGKERQDAAGVRAAPRDTPARTRPKRQGGAKAADTVAPPPARSDSIAAVVPPTPP